MGDDYFGDDDFDRAIEDEGAFHPGYDDFYDGEQPAHDASLLQLMHCEHSVAACTTTCAHVLVLTVEDADVDKRASAKKAGELTPLRYDDNLDTIDSAGTFSFA